MVLTMRVSLLKSTLGKVLAHLSASMVDRVTCVPIMIAGKIYISG